MLGDITVADEIYVICGYTDMRKSIDGKRSIASTLTTISRFCGL